MNVLNTTAELPEETYEEVVEAISKNIPSLPQILGELISRLSDVDSSLESIQDLVEVDQAIATRILKVSNKVEFLEPDEPRITSIHDALHKIGLEHAKRISLNVSVLNLMEHVEFPKDFRFPSLWRHCLGVAVASSVLSDETGYENPDQAYACGLLHDIGKLIKIKFSQKKFCEEMKAAREGAMDLKDFEMINELLMHDHLGFRMMQCWQMPKELSSVIRYHHTERRASRQGVDTIQMHHLIDLVYLANLLVNKLELGNSGHSLKKSPSPELLDLHGLDEERLVKVERKILKGYEENASFLAAL